MGESTARSEERDREMREGTGSFDLFDMLRNDHRHVRELFTNFQEADTDARSSIAEETLAALEVHTALEEELVYPAIAKVIEEAQLIKEAREEHHVAKLLLKELHKMDAGDEEFATKFKVLGELVGHHIEEEEGEIFPQAEERGLETEELSQEVMKRKEKLVKKYEGGKKPSRRKKAA